jgi:hypothetical protein
MISLEPNIFDFLSSAKKYEMTIKQYYYHCSTKLVLSRGATWDRTRCFFLKRLNCVEKDKGYVPYHTPSVSTKDARIVFEKKGDMVRKCKKN